MMRTLKASSAALTGRAKASKAAKVRNRRRLMGRVLSNGGVDRSLSQSAGYCQCCKGVRQFRAREPERAKERSAAWDACVRRVGRPWKEGGAVRKEEMSLALVSCRSLPHISPCRHGGYV